MKVTSCLATLSLSAVAGLAAPAMASNYPPDYCVQYVRVVHDGPALFAHVGSGCESVDVLGYKASGVLAADNPDHVDAILEATCGDTTRRSVIRLGREWHGTGYMSQPHEINSYLPAGCQDWQSATIGVAFSANGKWDSKYGQNYAHPRGGWGRMDAITFNTHDIGYGAVTFKAWDFIVGEMAKD